MSETKVPKVTTHADGRQSVDTKELFEHIRANRDLARGAEPQAATGNGPDYKAVAAACWRAGCDEQDGPARIERILASYTEEVVSMLDAELARLRTLEPGALLAIYRAALKLERLVQ